MQNITIGRYTEREGHVHYDDTGARRIEQRFAGWIEGVRDDGSTWIMWLDAAGSPEIYWGQREPDGGVIGDGIPLA